MDHTKETLPASRIWRVGGIAAFTAAVANAIVWLFAREVLDVSDEFEPLESVGPTIVSSLIGVGLGTLVLFALDRLTDRPIRLFRIIGVAIAIVSLMLPLGVSSDPGGDTKAILTLMVMHIVAAAIAIGLLTTRTRST